MELNNGTQLKECQQVSVLYSILLDSTLEELALSYTLPLTLFFSLSAFSPCFILPPPPPPPSLSLSSHLQTLPPPPPPPPPPPHPPVSTQLLGFVTTGIGIWGLVDGSQGDYDVITGDNTISAAAVLLTAGVITLALAAVGICGAWGMWRPVLIIVSGQQSRFFLYIKTVNCSSYKNSPCEPRYFQKGTGTNTVEPLNKGHFGANSFVPCREVVLSRR